MGSFGIIHWLVVLAIVLLLFGSRLPNVMGDIGKGIRSFKAGLNADDDKDAKMTDTKAEQSKLPPGDDTKKS